MDRRTDADNDNTPSASKAKGVTILNSYKAPHKVTSWVSYRVSFEYFEQNVSYLLTCMIWLSSAIMRWSSVAFSDRSETAKMADRQFWRPSMSAGMHSEFVASFVNVCKERSVSSRGLRSETKMEWLEKLIEVTGLTHWMLFSFVQAYAFWKKDAMVTGTNP